MTGEEIERQPYEDGGPNCCFGASKRQTFVLKVVIGCIMVGAFFGVVMTDDHNVRFAFAITGAALVLLSYGVGMAVVKYLNTPQVDWDTGTDDIILFEAQSDDQEGLLQDDWPLNEDVVS
jgi:hypothetical protein